jgi:hypothetical protein
MRWLCALPVLAALLAGGTARADGPTGPATETPNLQLSSSFFRGGGAAPDDRNVLALVLTAQTLAPGQGLNFEFSLGWIRMSQPAGSDPLVTARLGNALVAGNYRFPFGHGVSGELGLGLVVGLTALDPEPKRRLVRLALGHGIAMQGVCDAWLWAPGRGGFLMPARLHSLHPLGRGRWAGSASLEAVFLATMPKSDEGESSLGQVLQLGGEYAVLPRPWLAAGTRAHFVWMPRAVLWKGQWSVSPFLAVVLGRWRIAGDLLVNIDEPYGFTARGQRIWAASLKVGAWL